jgi:hypothetical protein
VLTVGDLTGTVLIRALVDLVLDDGRHIRRDELAQVPFDEAQRHMQRASIAIVVNSDDTLKAAIAVFEPEPEREPRTCSARRDELWKGGIK